MSWILEPFRGALFEAIGWALVNFLWQGMALALVLRVVLVGLRGARASTRYLVACAGLLLMTAAPVVGTVVAFRAAQAAPATAWAPPAGRVGAVEDPVFAPGAPAAAAAGAPAGERAGLSAWVERAEAQVQPWLPLLVLAWLAGVVLGAVRLLGGWLHLRRLRTRWTCEVSPAWTELFERLVRDMAISRPVRLVGSTRIDVPAVAGALKPVVLVPASILSGLPLRDVEMILSHELAHVRRHDYLVNLVQAAVETLLFFHPGVWWVSGVIRDERENCCDDIVVAGTGRGKRYARALLAAEELRAAGPGLRLAPALGGGSLYRRIRRIVAPAEAVPSVGGGPLGVALLVLLAAVLAVGQTPLTASARAASAPAAPAARPAAQEPPQAGELMTRWRAARARAAAEGWSGGYWIGYAVQGSASRIRVERGEGDTTTTVRGLLTRTGSGQPVVRMGDVPGGTEVALLFRISGPADSIPQVMRMRTLGAGAALDRSPVVWLGTAPQGESLGLLDALYPAVGPEVREEAVAAAALHGPGPDALAFVQRVLEREQSAGIRAEAAYWLQHQGTPEALALLERVARGDASPKVREEAVTGIAKTGSPAAREVLARLEQTGPTLAVRREAGDWLLRSSPPR